VLLAEPVERIRPLATEPELDYQSLDKRLVIPDSDEEFFSPQSTRRPRENTFRYLCDLWG
jgi:hypothetical protein